MSDGDLLPGFWALFCKDCLMCEKFVEQMSLDIGLEFSNCRLLGAEDLYSVVSSHLNEEKKEVWEK